jgi:dienelactone hydrolase
MYPNLKSNPMSKKLFFILQFVSFISFSQTFPVGRMTINFKDASRSGGAAANATITVPSGGSGRSVGTELFYPSTTAGNNTSAANGQFPVVVFGHGFVMAASDYTNVANRLAGLGYIVALPRTENEGPLPFPFPDHAEFANDIKFLASAVQSLNTTTITSLNSFNGKVTNKSAIGGHSMGGGCSFIAAQNNSTVTCLFNMAAATSNTASSTNSSNGGAGLVTIPTLVISGEKDNVADTIVQNSHYTPTASSIKFHVIIKDVTHCDFGNGTSTTCNIGQAPCSGANCNQILFEKYMAYLEPFLANQLKSNCAEGQRFMDSINTVSPNRVGRKITGILPCISTNLSENNMNELLSVFPNPIENKLSITFKTILSETKVILSDVAGRIIYQRDIDSTDRQQDIDVSHLETGIYFLKVSANNKSWAQKIIKY